MTNTTNRRQPKKPMFQINKQIREIREKIKGLRVERQRLWVFYDVKN